MWAALWEYGFSRKQAPLRTSMLRKGNAALTKQVVHVDHAEQAALFVQLAQGFRQEACFGKLRKALGPHDFADVELQALPQAASGMVAQEIFFRK